MNYKKEMEKMGWNEQQTVNRINSLTGDNWESSEKELDLKAEDLTENTKGFIKTDEEQKAVNSFFNREDE